MSKSSLSYTDLTNYCEIEHLYTHIYSHINTNRLREKEREKTEGEKQKEVESCVDFATLIMCKSYKELFIEIIYQLLNHCLLSLCKHIGCPV